MNLRFVFLATLAAACGPDQTSAPVRAQVTMFTLQGALAANVPSLGEGLSKVFPGFPPGYFLKSSTAIKVASAYTAGLPTPYMTTDIWINYPAVWIQPLYIFVSSWNSGAPQVHPHKWVLGTGPKSPFWSPFWQTFFVELPADVPDGTYTSARAILNAKLPIHAAGGRLATVVPDGMRPDDTDLYPPFAATVLKGAMDDPKKSTPVAIRSWVDGTLQDVLDFGPDRFEWNDRAEVIDAPLFFFFMRGPDGRPTPLAPAPRIGGTGPLFVRKPAVAPSNRPLFGSFWRLWAAHLPPGKTSIFIPKGDAWNAIRSEWYRTVAAPGYTGPRIVEPDDTWGERHAIQIALELPEADCFKTKEKLDGCKWLDSQEALETHLGASLAPSEITVACPYMGYAGLPVPRLP